MDRAGRDRSGALELASRCGLQVRAPADCLAPPTTSGCTAAFGVDDFALDSGTAFRIIGSKASGESEDSRAIDCMKYDSNGIFDWTRKGIWSAAWLSLMALPVAAHPGHGLTEASAAHVFTSPDHCLVLVGIALVLGLSARLVRRSKVRRWMQLGAALTCGVAIAIGLR